MQDISQKYLHGSKVKCTVRVSGGIHPPPEHNKHMKPASQTPSLLALALACDSGACNLAGLARSLPAALDELDPWTAASHPAVQVIIGQLAWLCGQAAGPTAKAYSEFRAWRTTTTADSAAANAGCLLNH